MKRDMDLVRHILVVTEDAEGDVGAIEYTGPSWDLPMVHHHLQLMAAHGLIDLSTLDRGWHGDVINCTVHGLTWDGADFLDAVRDERIWERAKRKVAEVATSVTMDTMRHAAVSVARAAIDAAIGPS